ncbi:MAG: hypothetical protein L0J76_04515 [Tetragenococcus halophilus]|nr:hypothetical protein [Tetragenococcus halophilus]
MRTKMEQELWDNIYFLMGPDDSWMNDPERKRKIDEIGKQLGIKSKKSHPPKNKITKEQKEEVRELRSKGLSYSSIASKLGIKIGQVSRVFNPNVYEKNGYSQKQKEMRDTKIFSLHEEGLDNAHIARVLGVHANTVKNVLNKNNKYQKEEVREE